MTMLLEATGLVKRYGALAVVNGVGFHVAANEAVGIVGPNGAGKTSLLNLLSGAVPVSEGRITLRGEEITGQDAAWRCRHGIGRSHQVPKPFGGMTVFENLLVAATQGGGFARREAYDRAVDSLELCGMLAVANRPAETLGLLERKRLELARALATGPDLLLLDEIGGGLTDGEALELVEVILDLRRRGIAIVWIEHIVHILVKVVTRLVCMDAGRIIAEGEPQAVLKDPVVISAYLGSEEVPA
ncbi:MULTISPECIES: ABC transporter ATP-binding protein [unclassified Acidocella]|uniref:ABC transporter ATP-binding protein n=1 Tax=unclassified Acidocella TaxID=2648610 RepID=UPI00028EA598|nr:MULTISPECIES: ABC transporter ATP-binding protein [unclassified Acidocella]EKN00393.1 ABC transporter-like protein [Acidocella sp. MX-AZ02]WBO59952.1 ABC transporter ATP-binding protein [Acidocella sp. MX-AZ03]